MATPSGGRPRPAASTPSVAGADIGQAGDEAQQGGLAAAAGSDDAQDLVRATASESCGTPPPCRRGTAWPRCGDDDGMICAHDLEPAFAIARGRPTTFPPPLWGRDREGGNLQTFWRIGSPLLYEAYM